MNKGNVSCRGRIDVTVSEVYSYPHDSGSEKSTLKIFYLTEELVGNARPTWLLRIARAAFSIRYKFV